VTDLAECRDVETEVYQPAEDSRLLAEAVIADTEDHPADLALEVGTGSGYVADRVTDRTGARALGSDVNPHACRQARERGVEAVRADLLAPFESNVFDVVLFNPPYLPTDPDDERDDWMEVALSGGEDGRAVVEPFVSSVGRVLAPDGVVYLLVSSLAGVDEVVEMAAREDFSAVALRDESFPFETLTVLKLIQ
jgi:release factor glutamine methyltransferase